MIDLVSKNPLVRKIIDQDVGQELRDMLFAKELPFTESEYLESFVFFLNNEELKSQAQDHLNNIPESEKLNYIEKREANLKVADYILSQALTENNLPIISKIIHNQVFPADFLLRIAQAGDASMLEVLIENQVKMIAYPEILTEIENNPEANNFLRGKIGELREFYLEKDTGAGIAREEVIEDLSEMIEKEEITEASEDKEELGARIVQRTVSILQKINEMSISDRMKLALLGSKTERMILVKDRNKMVASAVIDSPKLTKDEILLIVRNRSIDSDLISRLSKNREWTKNYAIIWELIQNPKTPVKDAISFIKKLHLKDLRLITQDKNINPVVRSVALNYYKEKSRLR